MFFDISKLTEKQYLILMFVLNETEGGRRSGLPIGTLKKAIISAIAVKTDQEELDSLWYQGLVSIWSDDEFIQRDATEEDIIGLTFTGMAVLLNSADRFLDRVVSTYSIPDGVTAALVPLLDTSKVPAADRYVSTADNQEVFQDLSNELEIVKNELVKDQNANELPIYAERKTYTSEEVCKTLKVASLSVADAFDKQQGRNQN
jgi:hypothetical protein